jgi:hypothetical protein
VRVSAIPPTPMLIDKDSIPSKSQQPPNANQ